MAEVHAAAATVRGAMADAGLTDPADVHCVYVKTPELSPKRIAQAQGRGARLRTADLRAAAGLARGAAGLDLPAFKDGLRSVGLDFACCPDAAQLARVENLFIGTSADVLPTIRGRRHTIRTDFLWASAGAHAKAMANAVIAGVMGDPMFLSKSGSEHQGPRGSTCVAIFARP